MSPECKEVMLSLIGTLVIICLYCIGPIIVIFRLPLPLELRLSILIILILCCYCCCAGCCGSGNRTGTGTRTGNRTITSFDEFHNYDSNMLSVVDMGSVVERSNSSSFTHIRTSNCAIPTISRPILVDFSLQRQTSLHRPCWDFESRVAESDRLPISLPVPFSEPSNSVVANAPSASPLEWPLSLPSYNEVINQPNYEIEEEPPPTYDEIVLKINT